MGASKYQLSADRILESNYAENQNGIPDPLVLACEAGDINQTQEKEWRNRSQGMFSESCASPFKTYWPIPTATIAKCKYCTAASLLQIQPGATFLDFGPGCGVGTLAI